MNKHNSIFFNKKSKGRKMFIVFLLFFTLIFAFIASQNRTTIRIKRVTLDELEQVEETNYIIYFARDDCPECKKMDSYLHKQASNLPLTIYRIETRKEPNQEKLKILLMQEGIKEVPTFIQKENDKVTKVRVNREQKVIRFF